jgi:hypothetical protein
MTRKRKSPLDVIVIEDYEGLIPVRNRGSG